MDLFNTIVTIVAGLSMIVGTAVVAIRWAIKPLTDLKKEVKELQEFSCVVQEVDERQDKILRESVEDRRVLVKALIAVLEGLVELGANGPVKDAKGELNTYIMDKSFSQDISK